jgi:hypothetical protein
MSSSSTNSRYLSISSGHVNNLIDYILDVKPYHTKLKGIVEQYVFSDDVRILTSDKLNIQTTVFIGYDTDFYDTFEYENTASHTFDFSNNDFPFYLGNFIGLKIYNAAVLYPELTTVDGWVPLEFSYYAEDGVTPAAASESQVIRARLAFQPVEIPVFEIEMAYVDVNTDNTANLTFDESFKNQYLLSGYEIRQFLNEICWQEIEVTNPPPALRSFSLPSQQVPTTDALASVVVETLQVQEKIPGNSFLNTLHIFYDLDRDTPRGGLIIEHNAEKFIVNHSGQLLSPEILVESLSDTNNIAMPQTYPVKISSNPDIFTDRAFMFQLPSDIVAPFRLLVT